MNSFFLTVLFCLLSWIPLAIYAKNTLHVCTVASYDDPGLVRLQRCCEGLGLDLVVLGYGKPYPRHGIKLHYVREHLNTLPNDDILLFVDAFDVIILDDAQTILEKFFSKKAPFVISTEINCGPNPPAYVRENYPSAATKFRFINSGGYIGYVKFMKKLFDSFALDIGSSGREPTQIYFLRDHDKVSLDYFYYIDDQHEMHRHFLKNPEKFCLDYFCDIFLSLYLVQDSDLSFDQGQRKVLLHPTNTRPSIIHGNGPREDAAKKLLEHISWLFCL